MADISGRMPTPPPEPAVGSDKAQFNIVTHYRDLLKQDHDINQPIAAIESLIALLSASPSSTVSETLAMIQSATLTLKASSPTHSLSLSAGTDLFQRYIIASLQGSAQDFDAVRSHLLSNSKLFVARAKEARGAIAGLAKRLIQDNNTILICGHSRVVDAVLDAAAEDGTAFQVIHVRNTQAPYEVSWPGIVGHLRHKGVSVAEIGYESLAVAVRKATFALVGAESVVENGGAISAMGTHQMAILMKALNKRFYVAAESHKFVREYPLDSEDLGLEDDVLHFTASDDENNDEKAEDKDGGSASHRLDLTPPDYITALITESGVHQPNAVSEELIKIW